MRDLQPILTETLKQDPSRHQVWNVDKLYKRGNMCLKRGKKKQHMWDKGEEKYIIIYVCVCVCVCVCQEVQQCM